MHGSDQSRITHCAERKCKLLVQKSHVPVTKVADFKASNLASSIVSIQSADTKHIQAKAVLLAGKWLVRALDRCSLKKVDACLIEVLSQRRAKFCRVER